ncbi:MAG: methyltransferase domain-containing protein [Bacteroidota bacterium]|nr:methyltransferase domain-containing protein [Bacteroidota bacterium]
MKYDPIKRSLGVLFNKTPFLRQLFYKMLDVLLLRTWHVKKEVRLWASENKEGKADVLDAGSGFGQYSYFLSGVSKKWNIKGVDVKREQIEDCNSFFNKINRENIKFEYADLTNFASEKRYDLIISVDVMEHILEDQKVFEGFYNTMNAGGMVLISTPSDQGGSDVHDHDHDGGSFIDEHVRDGYNIEAIQQQLKKAGFSKTEAYYTYGTPGKISWKLSMKYPIQALNITKLFFVLLPVYYILVMPVAIILNYFDLKINHKTGTGLLVKAWK